MSSITSFSLLFLFSFILRAGGGGGEGIICTSSGGVGDTCGNCVFGGGGVSADVGGYSLAEFGSTDDASFRIISSSKANTFSIHNLNAKPFTNTSSKF